MEFGFAVDQIIKRTFEARFPDRRKTLVDSVQQPGLHWFRSLDDSKRRWVDGTPSSTGYTSVLARMFPDARFINLVRSPAKVVQSWMGASFRAPDLADANELVTHVYHGQKAGYLAHAAFGQRAMRVIFEDLVASPEAGLKAIFAFLEEDYAPDCVAPFAAKINSSGEPSAAVVAEFAGVDGLPVFKEMERWYQSALDPRWRIANDPESALSMLGEYAHYRIPLPK